MSSSQHYSNSGWPARHDVANLNQRYAAPRTYTSVSDIVSVQYERLPMLFRTVHIWRQVLISFILNWLIGPFVSAVSKSREFLIHHKIMLGVSWATLPDLPTYHIGVIMVGLAR